MRTLVNDEWNLRAKVRSKWAHWTSAKLEVNIIEDVVIQLEQIISIANSLREAGEINRVEHRLLQVALASSKVHQ
ncbi:MAG: hypothetical protein ACKVIO_04310, partial [Phycisphaerales bacterium]